ncbi:MAG: 1-acyl-sn-glycerol-3-phosphate acyltransferase [Actinomycetes bacterium]
MTDPTEAAAAALLHAAIVAVRRYNRLHVTVQEELPDQPSLIVANHGFGAAIDLNVIATLAALEQNAGGRPITMLTHQMAWTLGFGVLLEKFGSVIAGHDSARAAFAKGHHVLVFPGGDREAAKPWGQRNQVQFHGRTGFAQLAIDQRVPIVPIVTAGAGESLVVLASGRRLAKVLRLHELLRTDWAPVTVSIPWGLNVGLVGLVPYLPFPTALETVVLPRIDAAITDDPSRLAQDVVERMQRALDAVVVDRIPVVGRVGRVDRVGGLVRKWTPFTIATSPEAFEREPSTQ